MRHICIPFLLFAFIGSSYGQITSINIESIESVIYVGSVNPVDFPTHNFSGETIEMNSAGSSEVRIFLWFYNLTQTTQEWIISRRRINVDPSWTDFLGFGETTDQFGGVIIDGFTMDSVLWVAPGYISQTVENGEILGLYPFIYPTSA